MTFAEAQKAQVSCVSRGHILNDARTTDTCMAKLVCIYAVVTKELFRAVFKI